MTGQPQLYNYEEDEVTTPTTPVVPVTPDTGTPDIITHIVTALLPVISVILAWWHPHKLITTGSAQAAVIIAGILAAAVVHAVWLVQKNGLTKIGLAKTVSEEESWLKANWQTMRTEWAAAQPAIAALPDGLATINQVTHDVDVLKMKVEAPEVRTLLPAARQAVGEYFQSLKPAAPPEAPAPPA